MTSGFEKEILFLFNNFQVRGWAELDITGRVDPAVAWVETRATDVHKTNS